MARGRPKKDIQPPTFEETPDVVEEEVFDPKAAAERLTKKLEEDKAKESENLNFNINDSRRSNSISKKLDGKAPDVSDLEKLSEYSEEASKRSHPSENVKLGLNIHGKPINDTSSKSLPPKYTKGFKKPEDFDSYKDENGVIDTSVGAQTAIDPLSKEDINDPRSDNFHVCITPDCPVKDNCLRYRMRNKRGNKVPYFPEECEKGENGGYIPLSKHSDFTAYDPTGFDILTSTPRLTE